jgi:acetyltransferase-like isoleucine patch superfamily enzyme
LIIKENVIIGTSSIIYLGSEIGKDTYIADMVNIREGCKIGNNSTIAKMVSIEFNVKIGNHTKIMACSQIAEFTEIGDNVFIGPDVSTCVDSFFGRKTDNFGKKIDASKKIVIGDKAMIGAGVAIAPGIIVGENALIGMGSVVVGNVPSKKVIFGNPAKIFSSVDKRLIL